MVKKEATEKKETVQEVTSKPSSKKKFLLEKEKN